MYYKMPQIGAATITKLMNYLLTIKLQLFGKSMNRFKSLLKCEYFPVYSLL